MQDLQVEFVQIDCSCPENFDICEPFNIYNHFPTLKLFQGLDNVKTYQGALREEAIKAYLNRQSLPVVSIITADSLDVFKTSDKIVVIGFVASDDSESAATFASLAASMRDDYSFGVADDKFLAQAELVPEPGIAVYKDFDERKCILNLTHDKTAMTALVRSAVQPLLVEFLSELQQQYIDNGIPLGSIFTSTTEERDRLLQTIKSLAAKHKDRIQLGTIDTSLFDTLASTLHLDTRQLPAFGIHDPISNLQYPLINNNNSPEEPFETTLDRFISAFLSGHLRPIIESGPLPPLPQPTPLLTVVALTYPTLVLDPKKDVLLEFYTQWCAPCTALLPTYEALAALYAADPSTRDKVTIARMDAEANDFPDRDVRGFPWFKLYPAGAKKGRPVVYGGKRTVRGFVEFIREEGGHGVEVVVEE